MTKSIFWVPFLQRWLLPRELALCHGFPVTAATARAAGVPTDSAQYTAKQTFYYLTIFTSITFEGWVDVMYMLEDTFGHWYLTDVYFVLLIVFGGQFLLNLAAPTSMMAI